MNKIKYCWSPYDVKKGHSAHGKGVLEKYEDNSKTSTGFSTFEVLLKGCTKYEAKDYVRQITKPAAKQLGARKEGV